MEVADFSSTQMYWLLSEIKTEYPIYQPLRSGRIWHKVNF